MKIFPFHAKETGSEENPWVGVQKSFRWRIWKEEKKPTGSQPWLGERRDYLSGVNSHLGIFSVFGALFWWLSRICCFSPVKAPPKSKVKEFGLTNYRICIHHGGISYGRTVPMNFRKWSMHEGSNLFMISLLIIFLIFDAMRKILIFKVAFSRENGVVDIGCTSVFAKSQKIAM